MARYDFCPQCGTASANGDFCINCGASLMTSDDVVDRDASLSPDSTQSGSAQTVPTQALPMQTPPSSDASMPTVPIPVVPTPQGYLDEDGRPVDLRSSGDRGPHGNAPRRGVSKKLIVVAVVIVMVVAAACGWLVWRDRQHRSQLADCVSAVGSVKAAERKAAADYRTAVKLAKTDSKRIADSSLLGELTDVVGSQKPIAAADYVCDAGDDATRLRTVTEQARKDLSSQKAWLKSVNAVAKRVRASMDKQAASDQAAKDKAAKDKAAKEAERQSRQDGIETSEYVNARYAYSIQAPSDFVWFDESDNGDGRQFSSDDDDDIAIAVWGSHNADGDTPSSAMQQYLSQHDVSYHALGSASFVVTWEEDGTVTYIRELVDGSTIRAVQITYPTSSSDRGGKVVEAVAHTLKALCEVD